MSIAIGSLAEPDQKTKDFLVYAVYEADGHYEIAGESARGIEARRLAALMAAVGSAEGAEGAEVHYEAWQVSELTLLFTTSGVRDDQ